MAVATEDGNGTSRRRPVARIGSLDGLRGVAALVVVVHHILLASWPALADGYFGRAPRRWSTAWWLFGTPLHIFWAGPEAVIVFFVLSGFVLALPAARCGGGWFDLGYYPKRLIRLYLPVWAALVVAVGCRELEPRVKLPGSSIWLQSHAVPMSLHGTLVQASLRDTGTFALDPVLWSLHWEVLYSVLLPIALVPALLTRRRPVIASGIAVAAVFLTGLGSTQGDARLTYLPMFVVGSVLAFHWHRLTGAVSPLRSAGRWTLVVLAVCLLTANYWMPASVGRGTAAAAAMAGAVLALMFAMAHPHPLERRTTSWLGSRSYSLYLVHEPIVVTLAFAMGGRPSVPLLLACALPLALGAAEIFWRTAENPSVRVATAAATATKALLRTLSGAGDRRDTGSERAHS